MSKKTKLILLIGIPFLLFLFFVILERIPVKRSVGEEELQSRLKEENTYVCKFTATTGPSWEIYEWNSDSIPQLVCLEGNVPFDSLNQDLFFFAQNEFLIQGGVIGKRIVDMEGNIHDYYGDDKNNILTDMQLSDGRYECYDIIHVQRWDIIEPIDRGDSLRFLAPKKYLSVLDFWKE